MFLCQNWVTKALSVLGAAPVWLLSTSYSRFIVHLSHHDVCAFQQFVCVHFIPFHHITLTKIYVCARHHLPHLHLPFRQAAACSLASHRTRSVIKLCEPCVDNVCVCGSSVLAIVLLHPLFIFNNMCTFTAPTTTTTSTSPIHTGDTLSPTLPRQAS